MKKLKMLVVGALALATLSAVAPASAVTNSESHQINLRTQDQGTAVFLLCIGVYGVYCPGADQMSKEATYQAAVLRYIGWLQTDMEANAYRHAVWSAKMARAYGGDFATKMGNAYEWDSIMQCGATPGCNVQLWQWDSMIDVHNNKYGVEVGKWWRDPYNAYLATRYGIESPDEQILIHIGQCRNPYFTGCRLIVKPVIF